MHFSYNIFEYYKLKSICIVQTYDAYTATLQCFQIQGFKIFPAHRFGIVWVGKVGNC